MISQKKQKNKQKKQNKKPTYSKIYCIRNGKLNKNLGSKEFYTIKTEIVLVLLLGT